MFAPSTVAFVSLRLSLNAGLLVLGGVLYPGAHERSSPRLSIGDLSIIWAEARAPLAKRDPFSSTYHSNDLLRHHPAPRGRRALWILRPARLRLRSEASPTSRLQASLSTTSRRREPRSLDDSAPPQALPTYLFGLSFIFCSDRDALTYLFTCMHARLTTYHTSCPPYCFWIPPPFLCKATLQPCFFCFRSPSGSALDVLRASLLARE